MSASNIIAIVGATGNQGSSVAHTFLSLPNWHVRCLTRNTSSPAALDLAAKGAEVVQADLTDKESLVRAFAGAHAIFVNTDFWAPYGAAVKAGKSREESTRIGFDVEFSHVKNATDAAATIPTLRRFIYSALGPMKVASSGKYPHSGHWDSKAVAVDYIEAEKPDLAAKASFIYLGAYSTNPLLIPQKYPHLDDWALMLPAPAETRMPVIRERESTGPFVRALIEDEEPGLKLLAYDAYPTMQEAADTWNKLTGNSAKVMQVTLEEMQERTGLPYEVLDGPAFIGEFSFMHGVKGKVVEPRDLKNKVPTKTLEEILEAKGIDQLLGSKHPDM
ncbi:unnamed protein product [Clonostachys chloroleuca]|uniref:NmrA-like domain-containing protein n=1 Tax=Clonostachys chloroleuca TaxID=1926264 RepID=A0AA35MD08_9HYPO|nr:unnamed protein product [Clonostachys chloroleuca]